MSDEKFKISITIDPADSIATAKRMESALTKVAVATGDVDGAYRRLQASMDRSIRKMSAAEAQARDLAKANAAVAASVPAGNTGGTRGALGDLRSAGYEMIVVGAIFTRFGTNIVQSVAGVVGAAIDYERAFANVIRTTSDGSISMAQLRDELTGLAATLPVTFDELAKIAALGGQLGIKGSGIDEFTSVVARLTATTDLTADAAGTALGRFNALLGVAPEDFEKLASAILKVGVNSVATETQIVAISTQISSMADFAGYTAEQVVGLAGALASVGAAPELSRGTITRTFALISKAVAEGGSDLGEFARIAGVSSEEFSSAFGTSRFSPLFQSFLANLGEMQTEGENTVVTLNRLGISSVRDVPLLLRLAGATDTVARSFDNAKTGFADGTELQRQYGIIATTTASRIQLLVNNITNLFAILGGGTTGPISFFVDQLSLMAQAAADFLATDIGQGVAIFAIALTALIGVVFTIAGGLAFAAGTGLLFANALDKLGLSAVAANVGVKTLQATIATGVIGTVAAASIAVTVGQFALLTAGSNLLSDSLNQLWNEDFPNTRQEIAGMLGDADKFTSTGFVSWVESLDRGLAGAGLSTDIFSRKLVELDDELTKMVERGQFAQVQKELEDYAKASNTSVSQVLTKLPNLSAAIGSISVESRDAASDTLAFTDALDSLATQLRITPEELTALQKNLASGSSGFISFSEAIQKAYEDGSGSVQEFSTNLTTQIDAQQVWADNLAILAARGATGFVSELARLGPEGAAVAADAVNLTSDELFKLEDQARLAAFLASDAFAQEFTASTPALIEAYRRGGITAVEALITATREGAGEASQAATDEFGRHPILVQILTDAAKEDMDRFIAQYPSIRLPLDVYVRSATGGVTLNGNYVKPTVIARAAGGYISGPGSGTSDSIPARLSNGEYVIRAASVQRYGTGIFDQLNRGVAKFARGGPVGGGSSAASSIGMGIMELGPKSLSVMRDAVRNEMGLYLDPMGVARLANKGNRQLASQGAR